MNRNYTSDDVIFREGDAAGCMYVVTGGKVGVFADYGGARQKLLKEYTEGQYFGEMGLLEHAPRSAAAVALTDGTRLHVVTEENFGEFFNKDPGAILRIMRQMSLNLRRTNGDYMEVCREIQTLAKEDLK